MWSHREETDQSIICKFSVMTFDLQNVSKKNKVRLIRILNCICSIICYGVYLETYREQIYVFLTSVLPSLWEHTPLSDNGLLWCDTCHLIRECQRFGETCWLHLQSGERISDSIFLRKVDTYLLKYTHHTLENYINSHRYDYLKLHIGVAIL